jgi:hypothetical protein
LHADLYKEGYTTTWEITVFNEDGDEITTGDLNEYDGPPPWRGSEFVEITWLPPQDLDPQELTFELKIRRCTPKPDVQILGQGEPPGEKCTPKTVRGELAYGAAANIKLSLRDQNEALLARSGSRRNNQTFGLGTVQLDTSAVQIVAEGVPEKYDELTVAIQSRPSLRPSKIVKLTRSESSNVLKGSFSPLELFKDWENENGVSFSSFDWSLGLEPQGDTSNFLINLLNRDAIGSGRVFFSADSLAISSQFDGVDPDSQLGLSISDQVDLNSAGEGSFKAGGYETVQVEVKDSQVNSRDRVLARFANGANVLMLSGHGSYVGLTGTGFGNVILADRTGPKPQNAFSSDSWRSVRTLIVAGCVSCNLNDYALNSKAHLSESDVGTDFFERVPQSSPARTLKETIHPQGIILGYQSAAPEAPADIPPLRRFFQNMGPTWTSEDTTTPLLWMRAHAAVDFLDNASAMDNQAFYYISHEKIIDPPRMTLAGMRQKITHSNRWIRRVSKSEWDKPLRSEHEVDDLDELPNISIDVLPVGE